MNRAVFTFPTTDMAMWAEETAKEEGIPAELVPAPAGSEALCDLALETFPRYDGRLTAALEAVGIDFSRWPVAASPPHSPDARPAAEGASAPDPDAGPA